MDKNLLDKNRGKVLYRQLADTLRQLLLEGHLLSGSRIPTEFGLSDTFGVSRGTVRRALCILEKEGLIKRIPGLGTFLNSREIPSNLPFSERRIGLIVPEIQDQLSLNILVGAESVAKKYGYQVVFNFISESLEQEKKDIARMREDRVAGMIIFPVSNCEYDESVWHLHQEQYPFVLLDRFFPNLSCSYVISDNLGGGFRATEHLIILGYHPIIFLYNQNADLRTTSVRDRYLGYRKALEEYNLPFNEQQAVMVDEDTPGMTIEDWLKQYMLTLTASHQRPAIFSVNDYTAIKLMTVASRLGVKIPDDLAVVGFDNLKETTHLQIPLTTINVHRTELGERAAQMLIERIERRVTEPMQVVLPTELIVRESCGARQRIRQSRTEISQF